MEHRILIIEDNPTNLDLMTYLLESFGYRPQTAPDGEAALALINRKWPHLVLCDIHMPRLDGYELARRMKADPHLRHIPIVAVTALAMVGDREKGLAAGFDGYITKPIDTLTFVQRVETFLGLPGAASSIPASPGQPDLAPPRAKNLTVLAVDDLSTNLKLVQSIFEPHGYLVRTASGISSSLAIIRECAPDVILSDVHMRDGTGYELCETLKETAQWKDIPIVLITSTYCDDASRKKGLAAGAARYLFRPVDSAVLLAEVEACLPKSR